MENSYTFEITSYNKSLFKLEKIDFEKMIEIIENYSEPLPKEFIKNALSKLQIGETVQLNNYSINKGKLFACLPENNRNVRLTRLS